MLLYLYLCALMLQLQGKTDQRFVECAFKVFRGVLGIKPVVNPAQFLEQVCVCSHIHPAVIFVPLPPHDPIQLYLRIMCCTEISVSKISLCRVLQNGKFFCFMMLSMPARSCMKS